MDIDLIVRGHGSVVKKDVALKPILKYFTRLISQVRKFHKDNVSSRINKFNSPKRNFRLKKS